MKKLLIAILLLGLFLLSLLAWQLFGSTTTFQEKSKTVYIHTGHNSMREVVKMLATDSIIRNENLFQYLVKQIKAENKFKPGKYIVKKRASLFSIIQKFRNNDQASVNLIITKLRTSEDLARLVGKKFECDSMQMIQFLNNEKKLNKFGVNPQTVFTIVFPNTYTFYWTSSPEIIFKSLHKESEKFWNEQRKQKATKLGLTEKQVYILASIVEEETNAISDKAKIASVYLNRIQSGMLLQADPTVKFALKDFGIKRVMQKHLLAESPYNTYRYKGLPPGPICTPSLNTIEEVLNSTKTDYLYFVANSDFSGTHIFTTNYADHLKYAREFQKALTILMNKKQNNP